MSGYNLSPLATIPAELLQAVGNPTGYLEATTGMLRDTLELDYHLSTVSIIEKGISGTDIFIDCSRMEREPAYQTFLNIRSRRDRIFSDFSLLSHAAGLLDYTAHQMVNIMPATERGPRHYATVSKDGNVTYPWGGAKGLQYSFAVYLGISPFPVFFNALNLMDEKVAPSLTHFGFGLYPYLALTVVPQLAMTGIPRDILRQWDARPIARAAMNRAPDGSYIL